MMRHIPARVLDQVLADCRERWPHEACGLLAGPPEDGPTERWPMRNVAEHPRYRYAMDPDEQLTAWRAIDAARLKVFAIYHSHTEPGDLAEPSMHDRRYAVDPDVWHLIIPWPAANTLARPRLWKITEDGAFERPYVVVD
jgi:proteasome lid subunit RPN8/RPN11